jgi:uncharacterized protein DUF4328
MSTPSGDPGNPWAQPGDPSRPEPQPAPSGYGTPSSPSYGKYGQGQALPTAPAQPPGPPTGPPPGSWGQPGYVPLPSWKNGPVAFQASGALGPAVIGLSVLFTIATWLTVIFPPSEQPTDSTDLVFGPGEVFSLLSIPVLIAVWIVTCAWLSRARANALILSPQGQRRSEGWVWFGWIVPITNLWFPKQILDDVTRATVPAAGDNRPAGNNMYWALWLSTLVFSAAGAVSSVLADLSEQDALTRSFGYAEAVALTVTLWWWIRVVRRISSAQDRLAANGAGGQAEPAAPTLQG